MNESSNEMIFSGSMHEFEQLINDNKLLLYSIVYSIAGNLEADDIVQESFIYAYYHYGSLKNKTNLSSWLCTIARNKAYGSIKRARRFVSMDDLGSAVSSVTPESVILRRDEKEHIMREVYALSEKYRETVMLYYFAEKSVREISEILSIPEGTVKFRLADARKKLRKELFEMFEEEKKTVENKDIFSKIKETTEKARKAIKENDIKSAAEICDEVLLDSIDLKNLSNDERYILSDFYHAKIRSIMYTENRDTVNQYVKKVVEIAESSGDDEWISSSYSYYASHLSNAWHKEEASKYRKLSLERAEKTGKASIIADCSYWCGIDAFNNDDFENAKKYFSRILEMKETLFADKDNECSNKTSYALAYSAYTVIKNAGSRVNKLKNYASLAPVIERKPEGYSLSESQGSSYSSDSIFLNSMDIFSSIAKISPFLSEKIKEGYTFEQNTFSYSYYPVQSLFEVVSMNETYETPDGKFENCLHIRYTNQLSDNNNNFSNRITNGITDIWYAPNIGIAGYTFAPIEGKKTCLKLSEYHV